MKNFGIILIMIGILMMIYTGYDYVTTKRVADIGPIKIDKDEHHPIRWSPIIGMIILIGGVVIVAFDKNKK